ncbi:MAG: RNA-guided pseudouridylation complex pseudouridine synthase subunit Cbf5 [Candidatus Micrarchaeia archaeon]
MDMEKRAEASDPRWGCEPGKRTIAQLLECGVIFLDKPCGPSSHEATAYARKILGVERAGHGGTLDPQVSGVLPIGLGRGARVIGHMGRPDKEYVGIMRTKMDAGVGKVRETFAKFTGEIIQTPPKMSAVRKVPRKRKVYYLELAEFKGRDFLFTVGCEAGTYIRTLCTDMGKAMGGAAMIELRRTAYGPIKEGACWTLQEISDAWWQFQASGDEKKLREILLPPEAALTQRKVTLSDGAVDTVCRGAPLAAPGVARLDGGITRGMAVAMLTSKGELVGFGTAAMDSREMLAAAKGVAVRTDAVIMKAGTYPQHMKARKEDT